MTDHKLKHLLHEMHHVDEELIHLLGKRVRLSQEFYAREAEEKEFHKNAEINIYLRIKRIANAAELDEEFVKKMYKRITSHAKKHRKHLRKQIETKEKELREQQKALAKKKKQI